MSTRGVGRGAPTKAPRPQARPGSETVSVEGCAALRQGDPHPTRNGVLAEGSPTVSADGLPLSHEAHAVTDGGPLGECASTVEIAEGNAGTGEGRAYVRFHIHVDADRDGVVDDEWKHNGSWSAGRGAYGAVVLVNCDDDAHAPRSPGDTVTAENGHPISLDNRKPGRTLSAEDLEDVSPLVLRRDPATMAETHAGWRMRLRVSRRHKLRVFDRHAAGAAELIGPETSDVHEWADLGQSEIVLCMEALQYPGPYPWREPDPDPDGHFDGRLVLTLEMIAPDGSLDHTEEAVLRATPWIAFNHFDPTVEVLVTTLDPAGLLPDLERTVGVPLARVENAGAVWAQDAMEPGFSTVPRATPPESWHLESNLTGLADESPRSPVYELARPLVSPGMGYAQSVPIDTPAYTFDRFGNVEATPPFRHRFRGTEYPFGRIVYGERRAGPHPRSIHPNLVAFFRAQAVQAPIAVDTGWLSVGHVDEVISFLPMRDAPLGFRVLWSSPALAMRLLGAESEAQRGDRMMIGLDSASIQADTSLMRAVIADPSRAFRSVGSMLGDDQLHAISDYVETKLAEIRAVLADEIGLEASDFVPIPVLFTGHDYGGYHICEALTPDMVNGLVVTRGGTTWSSSRSVTFITPDPSAPVAPGLSLSTVFNDYVVEALGPTGATGVTVRFVNDLLAYHLMAGEVHCGTNSIRRAPTDRFWWEHINV